MIQVGELSGVNAARAVTQHLGLLARAYWFDPADPEDEASRWLGAAPFAPARAVMEGTAMTGWLLDPTLDRDERARRGALWSNTTNWEADLRAGGFNIAINEHQVRYVRVDEDSRPLTSSTMIKAVHGRAGVGKYSRWSKHLHNDPQAAVRYTSLSIENDGLGLLAAGRFREDEHLALLGDVARLLIDAGEQQAAYVGRSAAGLVDTCSRVVKIVDQNLPGLEAAVAARHSREQAHS